jgi:hypothetical protein
MVLYIDGPPYGSAACSPRPARLTAALVAIIARPQNRLGGDGPKQPLGQCRLEAQ